MPVLAALILAGTTGITVVTHHCNMSGSNSVKTGFLLPATEEEQCCCSNTETGNDNTSAFTADRNCCNTSYEQLKLTNFSIKAFFQQELVAVKAPLNHPAAENHISQVTCQYHLPVQNKYGGRYILNLNCQLLS